MVAIWMRLKRNVKVCLVYLFKCKGLLGYSANELPQELLKSAYTSIIRSQLEYCSAVFAPAANIHLHKFDVIQKIASRIITRAPSNAHSSPLQEKLGLESLKTRRIFNTEGGLLCSRDDRASRIKIGDKRFSRYAISIFNEMNT
nr:uncharacterized protein LOC124811930 [Hydra vulgaris]